MVFLNASLEWKEIYNSSTAFSSVNVDFDLNKCREIQVGTLLYGNGLYAQSGVIDGDSQGVNAFFSNGTFIYNSAFGISNNGKTISLTIAKATATRNGAVSDDAVLRIRVR